MIPAIAASMMRRPRHHILIFHRVMREPDPMSPSEPTAEWFSSLLEMLSGNFDTISLSEAVSRAGAGALSGRTVSVTFDDGYADNFEVALPLLEKYRVPATFFIASGYIDGGRMWNDSIIETFRRLDDGVIELDLEGENRFDLSDWGSRRTASASTISAWKHLPPAERQSRVDELAARVVDLPRDLMMTGEQLRSLAASAQASIGGHTRTHPILASLSDSEAAAEIEGGKRDLEDWLQTELELFAYPNGRSGSDFYPSHAAMARSAGFGAAVATDWGTLGSDSDPFMIPRFTPWQRNLSRFTVDLARCHFGLI